MLRQPLGRGGFATVWEADHPRQGACALKISKTNDANARRRFEREADLLTRIAPPFVPRLISTGVHDGRPYLVLEKLSTPTLAEALASFDKPPRRQWTLAAARALLTSLRRLEALALTHRDLKPENIFLDDPALPHAAVLIDLGTSRVTGDADASQQETEQELIVGTWEYMAPEQFSGAPLTMATDIYAFGVLLYEMCTLRVPFTGTPAEAEHGHRALRPAPPSDWFPVDTDLEELTLACLAKTPSRRPSLADIEDTLALATQARTSPRRRKQSASESTALRTGTRQPAVILVADLANAKRALGTQITDLHGQVARKRGRRYVCVFHSTTSSPARNALRAAQLFVDHGAKRVCLHLAAVRIRRTSSDDTAKIYGAPVDDPASWLPAQPWTGILATQALAEVLPATQIDGRDTDKFVRPVVTPFESHKLGTFVGRHAELAQLDEVARMVGDHRQPTLVTIMSAGGNGKTRLLQEFCERLQTGPDDFDVQWLSAADLEQTLCDKLKLAPQTPIAEISRALTACARGRPMALIVDDVHTASHSALDLLESATLDLEGARLLVATTADTELELRRPNWGIRAYEYKKIAMGPLAADATRRLAQELLHPVDFPPREILDRLANWSGGSPLLLEEVIRSLKRTGIVRKRQHGGSWYIATAALERLPTRASSRWLATRLLDPLPEELAAFACVCAVLGVSLNRDELESVQMRAANAGDKNSALDVDVGLHELLQRKIIRNGPNQQWIFTQPAQQAAIYQMLPGTDRVALHRHALEYWQNHPESNHPTALLAIARHASGSVDRQIAAETYLQLGDAARARHRYIDADQHYTSALDHASDARAQLEALSGRGRVRYRVQRIEDALQDLDDAAILAAALDENYLLADLLLEQATAQDWASEFEKAAELTARAEALNRELGDTRLGARVLLGHGRAAWRREQTERAVDLLKRASETAHELGDHETEIIALLLLPVALVYADRREEAKPVYERVIRLCETHDDGLHRCVAFCNRLHLWRDQPALAVRDLRFANELARELGQAAVERVTTHNLAEILNWDGEHDEAMRLARRAFALQRRLFASPVADDALLLARIAAATKSHTETQQFTDWIRRELPEDRLLPSHVVWLEALRCATTPTTDADTWERLVQNGQDSLSPQELLELLLLWVQSQDSPENSARALTIAEASLAKRPNWRRRFADATA